MTVSLALTLLLQAAAVTPTPGTRPTPTPTSTPTPLARGLAQPLTLQDLARGRRLKTEADPKGTPRAITLGPAAGVTPGVTPGATLEATPSASPAATAEAPADGASSVADVRVVSVSNDGIVDPTGGVRVTGTIRNSGTQTLCGVMLHVRILDNRGTYLSSAQVAPDVTILQSGETTSFRAIVQAPPGVRGARINPDRQRDVTDGSTTMAGDWKLLGGSEAKVVDAVPCPK
ncbi:MAG: FxLYD domain-containing protein [Acidobacteriota bacterium]|nr:FxLYD domain-containing protein [Acidobacteriota bacterium]